MTYQEEGLYPIFLGKNEFALVTGYMLNKINKYTLEHINRSTELNHFKYYERRKENDFKMVS